MTPIFFSRGKAALQIAVYVCFCLSVSLFLPITAFYHVPITESLFKFSDPKRSYEVPRSNISVPPEPLFQKHGTTNGWPWFLKWLEHSAWIRRLGVRVSLRSTHFLSQNLWHFHKNICLCVENECCCPCTVKILNVDLDFKNICTARASWKKTWDSKCKALVAQMVKAFGMNPKVRCSSFPQVETFYASKTLVISQEHPFCVENECCCSRPVKIWNGNLTSKIFVLPEPV